MLRSLAEPGLLWRFQSCRLPEQATRAAEPLCHSRVSVGNAWPQLTRILPDFHDRLSSSIATCVVVLLTISMYWLANSSTPTQKFYSSFVLPILKMIIKAWSGTHIYWKTLDNLLLSKPLHVEWPQTETGLLQTKNFSQYATFYHWRCVSNFAFFTSH